MQIIEGMRMTLIRKDVFRLAIPILTEQVLVLSLGMVNTMMAGNIGKEAVSAIGMVDSVNNIFIAFFSALAVGATVVVAQYIGKGNLKMANESVKQALFASILISLTVTLLLWIFKAPVISFLYGSAQGDVVKNAHMYLGITLLTYPMIAIDLMSNGVLRGAGDTKTPMKITVFMNFLNVILSYTFINGMQLNSKNFTLVIPSMGIEGAAIGIAIARTAGAFLVLIVLLRGSKIIKLTKIKSFKFNKELLAPVFGIGVPASVESLIFNMGKLLTQIYIVGMGTVAIASNVICGSIVSMLNVPGIALSTTAIAIVGQQIGRGKKEEAKKSLNYMNVVAVISMTLLSLIVVPFAGHIVSLYNQNPEIVKLSTSIIRMNAIFTPIWPLSFLLSSGLKGAGDAKYTMTTTIVGMWVFRITFGYILGIVLKFGLVGVWLGMYTDWVVRGILYFTRVQKGKWLEHNVLKS